MEFAVVALVLYLGYLFVAFGLQSWLSYRRMGNSGYRGLAGSWGSVRWWGGILFVAALVAGFAAPSLQLAHLVKPIRLLDVPTMHALGLLGVLLGTVLTVLSQRAMGQAWRIGVDEQETTELIRTGPFELVRNPFFTALLTTAAGLFLLAPNLVSVSALVLLVIAVELQVRAVEEPHLLATHGDEYRDYAREAGRFLPGVGAWT